MLKNMHIHKEAFTNITLGAVVSITLTYFMVGPLFRQTDLDDITITIISTVVFALSSHLRFYAIRVFFSKKKQEDLVH